MSKKSSKIAALIARHAHDKDSSFDPHYLGYFDCFNKQMHYEAHDVLEELWLETEGTLHSFYKGLIQFTGAFVHLKKSHLNPASRLFLLALENLEPHASKITERLDVAEVVSRIRAWNKVLVDSNYTRNPYDPAHPPTLRLIP